MALSTSIVAVIEGVLLRDLPFPAADRLIVVGESSGPFPQTTGFPTITDLRDHSRTLAGLSAVRGWTPTLTSPAVERLTGLRVSWNYFSILGVKPALGRDFRPEEDGPRTRFVVIVSHGLWQRAFGGDAGIIDRTIRLNETSFQVIGVMPAGFEPVIGSQFGSGEEIWGPLGYAIGGDSACRGCRHLRAIGALAEGVRLEQARDELVSLHRGLTAAFPGDYSSESLRVERLEERIARPVTPALTVLAGAVALVLLIAAANAVSLTLTRAADLEHEMALRAALGASRGRVARHRLIEVITVAGLAAAAGLAGGEALTRWLVADAPAALPRADQIGLGWPAILLAASVTIVFAVVVALIPVLRGPRIATSAVAHNRSTGGRGLIRTREALVVVDVALALTLSACAGIMVRSVDRLLAVPSGVNPDDVSTAQLALVGPRWATDDAVRAFQRGVLERVMALPGVTGAALTGQVPLGGNYDRRGVYRQEKQTGRAEDEIEFERYSVSPDYLRVMGIPLLRGRGIEDRDRADTERVMLINDNAARSYWPGQNPIGHRIVTDVGRPAIVIVGIVGDVRHYRLDEPPNPQMYLPQEQMTDSFLVLAVKGAGFEAQWPAVRQIVRELGPDVPLDTIVPMRELIANSAAPRRFTATVLGLFAVLATAMMAAGIYGLVAYTVSRRTREFGIRLALGASRGAIRRLVLGRGVLLTGIGVAAGLLGTGAAGRALGGIRYDTSVFDAGVIVSVVAILATASLLAHAAPVRRAAGVSPTEALRTD
jgi:putative ABC transport system permease protein